MKFIELVSFADNTIYVNSTYIQSMEIVQSSNTNMFDIKVAVEDKSFLLSVPKSFKNEKEADEYLQQFINNL